MDRRFLNVGLAYGLAGLLLAGAMLPARSAPQTALAASPANVAPQVWAATADGGEAEFLVVLAEQADLSAVAARSTREARLRSIYDTLREVALRSQAPLRAELDAAGVEYRPFYIVNMLVVKGDRTLVMRLAARPDVARIAANPHVRQHEIPRRSAPRNDGVAPRNDGVAPRNDGVAPRNDGVAPRNDGVAPQNDGTVEWNVVRVNADDVWALGYTGQSIVVAGQDTGYEWDHPALVRQYRGYDGITATHDYNWHDAIHTNEHGTNVCGVDSPEPCDDYGHGTHTLGTIVGDDGAGNRIGVAPGARWIGCRNMDNGWGTPATYAECFEFFLAPYPVGGDPFTDGRPDLAPHVINNSWTCPPREECEWSTLQLVVETVRAAGIVVVVSAGNSGSACGTVEDPPAIYDAAFSVGATERSDNVAYFSSRGPVMVDGSGRLKPDVVAPGVEVRSSTPGGGYGLKQGTSMAAPHVAGTVALLWSAVPYLTGDVGGTEQIIAQTARPRVDTRCGGEPGGHPNNVYGWGIVDALAAVQGMQAGLTITKQAVYPMSFPVQVLIYTLGVTNTSAFTLSQVVITDAIPVSTTLAWASGSYMVAGNTVTWTAASLAGWESLTATLAVTVEHLPSGTHVVNAAYGVRANEVPTSVMGAPVEVIVPWRYIFPLVFRDWSSGENGDG